MRTDERHLPIRLRIGEYQRFAKAKGLDDNLRLAQALGMAHTTVSRVMAERMSPGPRFVANSMHVLGVTFEAVFTTNPDPDLITVEPVPTRRSRLAGAR